MRPLNKRRVVVDVAAGTLLALLTLAGVIAAVKVASHGVAVALLAGVTVLLLLWGRRLRRRMPRRTILEVDFERGVVERTGPAQLVGGAPLRLRDIVEGLERAADDDRVVGLIARVGGSGIGLAMAQEIRDAVLAFRTAGKRAVAFAETLGEGEEALSDYYLATAFDEVVLQPAGSVGFTGMLSRVTFLRMALDKLGILPYLDHREEYKTARNRLTETGFTPAHRESVTSILDAQYETVVTGIASGRGLTAAAVRAAGDDGPLLASEALERGMVDRLGYRDEAYGALQEETGGELLFLDVYVKRAGRPHRRGTGVAFIYATGTVTRGRRRFTLLPAPGEAMASDTVAAAFRSAVADPKVKAIVCRVDSRGGSAVASDVILRHVVLARESGKPVVITMGDYAASGGYYLACRADRIVAQPATITGSIGVVSGKLVAAEALRRIGVTSDDVGRGANATFWSVFHDYDERGQARLGAILDDVYERFIDHVAQGRGLAVARVRELAGGRVWTGAQAFDHGLVDALGGTHTASGLARQLLGLDATAPLKMIEYPRRRWASWHRVENSETTSVGVARALVDSSVLHAGGELLLPEGF